MTSGFKRIALACVLLISFVIIYYKVIQGFGFDVEVDEGILENGFMLFWPDELIYLNWLDTRKDSFAKILSGEREATNLFGYYVSFSFLVLGSWQLTYVVGFIGLFFFYFTANLLVNKLQFNRYVASRSIAFFLISPTVIMLSSSLLRDLYVIAMINLIIYFSFKRSVVFLLLSLVILFFLRNFYIPLMGPAIIYFWFYNSQYRRLLVLASCFGLVIGSFAMVFLFESIYETTSFDLIMRIVSALTGVSVELLRWSDSFNKGLLYTLEYLGLVYQAAITIYLFIYIVIKRLKLNLFSVVLFATAISLGIIYGHFLGYFVSRTKLILLWLILIYFMIDTSTAERKVPYDS